jgi:hypothetical protein
MTRKNDKPWQFKVSFALTVLMLFFVCAYFVQSFTEIRKEKPGSVAIERIKQGRADKAENAIVLPDQ